MSITETPSKIEKILQDAAVSRLLLSFANLYCSRLRSNPFRIFRVCAGRFQKDKDSEADFIRFGLGDKTLYCHGFYAIGRFEPYFFGRCGFKILPEFSGERPIAPYEDPLNPGKLISVDHGFTGMVDAGEITFRQVPPFIRVTRLASACLPSPLFPPQNKWFLMIFFSYKPDTDVVYSDLGFMLVGWAIEKICGMGSGSEAIDHFVLKPLQLTETGFRPLSRDWTSLLASGGRNCSDRYLCGSA